MKSCNLRRANKTLSKTGTFYKKTITTFRAGREVNLENILQHELMTVPLYLAKTSGSLHSTNNAVLARILTQQVQTPATGILDEPSCLLIDGQALVMTLGKPPDIRTFGDYANIFAITVFKMGANYQRIDVVFDRYQDESIKAGTMIKRKQFLSHQTGLASWYLRGIKQISLYYFQTVSLSAALQSTQW